MRPTHHPRAHSRPVDLHAALRLVRAYGATGALVVCLALYALAVVSLLP